MPARDSGSTLALPRWLLILAGALFVARVVSGIVEKQPETVPASSLKWIAPGNERVVARHTGRRVLYDFSAEWCAPCHRMEAEVFASPEVARLIERSFVAVKVVDRLREDGRNSAAVEELQRRYGVRAFPTLVALDPQSGKFERLEGYPGEQPTAQWLATNARIGAASAAPPAAGPGGP